ncbi:acyl-CoA dehydrogenase domain-containing protein [Halenospora varia]|nr:acyl-CoA dehydrogenase domain-containing protein [Halenospora varia]
MVLPFVSERAKKTLEIVAKFVEKDCIPADAVFETQLGEGLTRWKTQPSIIEDLKKKAKTLGIWNVFLPNHHTTGAVGFSNLEYGLMAEHLGKSITASEACNCNPPDTGNMEVLFKYGNKAQKKQWLAPLLAGDIRSVFLMTEPDIASSDAKNIQLTLSKDGDHWVLNGSKWWSSGAGHTKAAFYLVLGKSAPNNPDPYKQQSLILVPTSTPGITLQRHLSVFGYDDAPHGHGHFVFKDVRVPASNMILGEGRGFEIIQGRLGPGRIHHAMRAVGVAERALEWMIARITDERKKAFGKKLSEHGVILQWVAEARVNIDAARLIVLNAAIEMDGSSSKEATKEIAQAKILAPRVALETLDKAIQTYGGAGVSQDTPLAAMWAQARVLRIVDGPDEVHLQQLGKNESKRGLDVQAKIRRQNQTTGRLMKQYRVADDGPTKALL